MPDEDDGPHAVDEVDGLVISGGLGQALGPALHEACGDKLGEIVWFSTPWQRSGAATGYTHWRLPDGSVIDAIAKVPVGYREFYWSTKLGETDPMQWLSFEAEHLPVPRVLAGGTDLGGYDTAWMVVERVEGEPLVDVVQGSDPAKGRMAFIRLFDAAARFHRLACEVREPTERDRPGPPDWARLLDRSAERARDNRIDDEARWLDRIRRVRARLDDLVAGWESRATATWCHGDLHPGNVMQRRCRSSRLEHGGPTSIGDTEGVLIDLALVHAGHWVEDALYLERLFWGRETLLGGIDPVSQLAAAREAQGLENGTDAREVVQLRRVLMAATSPAFYGSEGDPVYLRAALLHLDGAAEQGLL